MTESVRDFVDEFYLRGNVPPPRPAMTTPTDAELALADQLKKIAYIADVHGLISSVGIATLHKAADRLAALTAEVDEMEKAKLAAYLIIEQLGAEKQRLREALEEIAKETGTPYSRIAREALKEKPWFTT